MSWKPIVVGVDDSPAAAAAAALGWKLAEAAKTKCHLVHATPDIRSAVVGAEAPIDVEELYRGLVNRVRAQIGTTLRGVVPQQAINGMAVWMGRAPVVLKQAVETFAAGLVVLGGKHHSVLGRWLAGSTAHYAVRTLQVPVLVTGASPTAIRRVLVAVDLSYAAQPTIEAAERFVALADGVLRAVHVLEPLPIIPEMLIAIDPSQYLADSEETLAREIWPLIKTPAAEKLVRHGTAAETISAQAVEWKADLVVVGSHGKGWVDRLLLGSVTERLLNHLPTSLLVVPVPAPKVRETPEAKEKAMRLVTPSTII